MRSFASGRSIFAVAAATTVLLASPLVSAADGDLPTGDDPPKIVPIGVVDTYYALYSPSNTTLNSTTNNYQYLQTLTTNAARHGEFAINLASVGARLEHAHLLGAVVLQAGTSVDALYPANGYDTHSLVSSDVLKHIQVAYVGYRYGDFTATVGVFPSTIGNESFVSTDNWNYMHTFISDMTPYFHEGAKVEWNATSTLRLTAVAYNSWQTFVHIPGNPAPAGGLRVDWTPSSKFNLFVTGHVGDENPKTKSVRVFGDAVAHVHLGKLGLAAEGWFVQENAVHGFGGAAWARYDFADRFYASIRGEVFDDTNNVLIYGAPAASLLVIDASLPTRLYQGTLTLGWVPHPNFVMKLEGSYRHSSQPLFTGPNTTPPSATTTITNDNTLSNLETHSIAGLASVAFHY